MKKILITGGSGFLGSHLCEKILNSKNSITGPINLGNPNELSIKQIAIMIKEIIGSRSKLIFKKLPSDDPTQRKPDISLAKEILNWRPKINLNEGLKKTISYFEKEI